MIQVPTLDFQGRERIHRTGAVSAEQFYSSDGKALANEMRRVKASVEKRRAGRDIAAATYYITYEVVIDDDGGPGRPLRPPAAGQAAGVVLAGMRQGAVAA